MKAEKVFCTEYVSRQVRRYFEMNPECPYNRKQLMGVLGLKEKQNAYSLAVSRLIRNGELIEKKPGFSYHPKKRRYMGDVADQVWKFMRYNPVFSSTDIAKGTDASIRYVSELLRKYERTGHIKRIAVVGKEGRRIYTMVDKNRKARPCDRM